MKHLFESLAVCAATFAAAALMVFGEPAKADLTVIDASRPAAHGVGPPTPAAALR